MLLRVNDNIEYYWQHTVDNRTVHKVNTLNDVNSAFRLKCHLMAYAAAVFTYRNRLYYVPSCGKCTYQCTCIGNTLEIALRLHTKSITTEKYKTSNLDDVEFSQPIV